MKYKHEDKLTAKAKEPACMNSGFITFIAESYRILVSSALQYKICFTTHHLDHTFLLTWTTLSLRCVNT